MRGELAQMILDGAFRPFGQARLRGIPSGALRRLAVQEGKHLSQGLAQVARLAGGLAAFFDGVQKAQTRGARGNLGSYAPTLDFRRLAFASGFGAFDLVLVDADAPNPSDPSSASSQGLTPPQPPKRAGDTWAQLKANYSEWEILWAFVWDNYRTSATNVYSSLRCEDGWQDARFYFNSALTGTVPDQRKFTKAMANWAWHNYPEPVPNVWRQNKPGAAWPCDPAACCWIDEDPIGGVPGLRVHTEYSSDPTERANASRLCYGASSYTQDQLMYESQCYSRFAPTLAKYRACHQKVGVARRPWTSYIHTRNRATALKSGTDPAWAAQVARDFPLTDPDCPWNPKNDLYWVNMLVPNVDFVEAVANFFNDAWNTVTKALDDCFGFDSNGMPHIAKPPYACLRWLANNVPQPVGAVFTLILEVPKLFSCAAKLFGSGPIEEKVQCFIDVLKESITQVVNTLHIDFDLLVIAGNAAVGNIPGAVIAGAKYVVSKIAAAITDPEAKAVLRVVSATADLVVMVMNQGPDVFKTEAFWQMFGATIQTVAPSTTVMAAMGRVLARNAEIPAMAIRGENVAAYVKKKWLDPAVALVQTAARSGAAVIADLGGDGDVFRDLDVLLRSVADIFDGVGDGINAVKILGTAGQDLKRIAANLRKAAATALQAGQILNQAKNVVGAAATLTQAQIEAMIKAAVDKALAEAKQGQVPSFVEDLKEAAGSIIGSPTTLQACLQAESANLPLTEVCRRAFCTAIASGSMNPAFAPQYRCSEVPAAPTYVDKGVRAPTTPVQQVIQKAFTPAQQLITGESGGGAGAKPPGGGAGAKPPPPPPPASSASSPLMPLALAAGLALLLTR